MVRSTLNTRCGSIFESVIVVFDLYRPRWCFRDRADFWGTLAKVGPLMRGRIIEPIGLGTVGAVYDPSGTRVLDPRNCLLTLYYDKINTETTDERILTGLTVCGRTICFALWPVAWR